MATKLVVDDRILKEALRVGGSKTIEATVKEALIEYIDIRRRKQRKIVDLFGTIDFDRSYDYKKQRRRR